MSGTVDPSPAAPPLAEATPSGEPGGVAFRTLGCKVNRVEGESVAASLLTAGARIVDEDAAHVVVISTCTVTGEADAKSRKAIRHALSAPGKPVVVVTGCGAAVDPDALRALGDRVIVESDTDLVAMRVAEQLALSPQAAPTPRARAGEGFRTRALLKVEDGCDAFCAYCIVPHARGVPRAVPLDQVASEARALVAAGVREIVLTGINIGRYDHDGAGLSAVVETVAASGIERLRLSSIEPLDLTPAFLQMLSCTQAFCPHLHVPLQSGSDPVLSAMGRRYSAAQYAERIEAARRAIPGLAVTTDVLCAFPGETDAQAEETLRFCEDIGFAALHVFRFSAREGTPAATMPGRIEPRVSAARSAALRAYGERLHAARATRRAGACARVLVEAAAPDGSGRGRTEDYLRVRVGDAASLVGRIVDVRLGLDSDGALSGMIEPCAC